MAWSRGPRLEGQEGLSMEPSVLHRRSLHEVRHLATLLTSLIYTIIVCRETNGWVELHIFPMEKSGCFERLCHLWSWSCHDFQWTIWCPWSLIDDRISIWWWLTFSPSLPPSLSSSLRLRVYTDEGMFLDSGCVCDAQIKGGRLGLYVFSQEEAIFSNLMYGCLRAEDNASLQQCRAA